MIQNDKDESKKASIKKITNQNQMMNLNNIIATLNHPMNPSQRMRLTYVLWKTTKMMR